MFFNILKCSVLLAVSYVAFISYTCYYPHNIPVTEWKISQPPYPSENFENLFWFVQVSDIHMSKFFDPHRGPDFQDFCSNTLTVIKPDLVLVTGDLTDAKSKDRYSSQQYRSEWREYYDVLQKTNVTEKYIWIDVRGNHDAFDVMAHNSSSNYYMKYSGDKQKLSKDAWNLGKPFGNYSFIPVDATLVPGPRRPFNFMGKLDQQQLTKLYQAGMEATQSNLTIWYGHYPSSAIISDALFGLRSILGHFGAYYLNGHFHNLHGIAPTMYAIHSNGFLELELSDWMQHRTYRVLAIDHDMLSFSDVTHKDWPVVVITNPKPATYMTQKHEPIGRIRNSTHVRFLVFSPSEIREVSVSIDGALLQDPSYVKGPLWVCKWDPSLYKEGMHQLEVEVEDESGAKKLAVSRFSLDDTWSTDFNWSGVFFILTDICGLIKVLFVILASGLVSTIAAVKLYGVSNVNSRLFNLHVLLTDTPTFFVVFVFTLNLLIGPLFVGELIGGHVGICFSYGMLIKGKLTNEGVIYVFCLEILVTSYIPIILYLSHCAGIHWKSGFNLYDTLKVKHPSFKYNILLIVHLCSQMFSCYWMMRPYGWLAGVINPACLWWGISTLFLLARLHTRNPQSMLRNT